MTPFESRCLEQFPAWLHSLAEDARALCQVLEAAESDVLRRSTAAALNYLFKSIDLIPDGLEDLGFLDDAFVFRVALARAAARGASLDGHARAGELAADAELIREFLGDDYARLEQYVDGLGERPVRGRSVEALISDAEPRRELARDVQSWAASFEAPSFLRDEKSLVKLRSFLTTRLAPAPA